MQLLTLLVSVVWTSLVLDKTSSEGGLAPFLRTDMTREGLTAPWNIGLELGAGSARLPPTLLPTGWSRGISITKGTGRDAKAVQTGDPPTSTGLEWTCSDVELHSESWGRGSGWLRIYCRPFEAPPIPSCTVPVPDAVNAWRCEILVYDREVYPILTRSRIGDEEQRESAGLRHSGHQPAKGTRNGPERCGLEVTQADGLFLCLLACSLNTRHR